MAEPVEDVSIVNIQMVEIGGGDGDATRISVMFPRPEMTRDEALVHAAWLAIDGTYAKLPCGCECWCAMEEDERVFVYRPCDLNCRFYRYAVDSIASQKKALEVHMNPTT